MATESVRAKEAIDAAKQVAHECKDLVRVVTKLNAFLAVCANNPEKSTFLSARTQAAALAIARFESIASRLEDQEIPF